MPSNLFKFGDWIYIVPLALLGLGLGIFGFMTCPDCSAVAAGAPNGGPVGFVPAVTHTLALIKAAGSFPLDGRHWTLFFAQIIMPALAFVSVFKLVLQNLRRDARVLWAQRLKDHIIVCGLGDTGRQIVESFRDAGKPVVVIALDANTPNAAACERRHVVVLEGDAGQRGMLRLAGLHRAEALVVACGSDGTNLEIAIRARDALNRDVTVRPRAVKILPELRSEWLYDLVRTQSAATLGSDRAEFRLVNLNANAARQLLRQPFFLRAAQPAPRLLFAGFGRVAAEILVRAARCNFALPGQRLSATVLDSRGPAAIAAAEAACSGIRDIADIDFTACNFTDKDYGWQEGVLAGLKTSPPLAVVVAVKPDDVALETAIRFRKMLDSLGLSATPVFVRVREQHKLGAFLSGLESQPLFQNRLMPFGSLTGLTTPSALLDQSLDTLARAAHDIWLKENAQSGSPAAVPWERLAEFHKQANRALADYIPVRLNACGLRLEAGAGAPLDLTPDEIEKLAALEHWRWCVELRSMGWRQADIRDDFLKHHNRLVEWQALPDATKAYNREMARLLPQTAAAAGMHLKRNRLVAARDAAAQSPQPDTQIVVLADPDDAQAWSQAVAAQAAGAKIWALLRPGVSPQIFARLQANVQDIEKLVGEAEWAALLPVKP
jgi:hypothetical protein